MKKIKKRDGISCSKKIIYIIELSNYIIDEVEITDKQKF